MGGNRYRHTPIFEQHLILTDKGFCLSELDSVPGGMGITAWLSHLYADAGFDILGGRNGIPEGFQKLIPKGGDILISEESVDYRPEMEWLADQLTVSTSVVSVEDITALSRDAYRFFEWFDLMS